MGGDYYGRDVSSSYSTNSRAFNMAENIEQEEDQRLCHSDLNIKNKKRKCKNDTKRPNKTPIVVAMDVTRSRGDDAKVAYGKLPMFIGQINMKAYVPDPAISFAAIGDATSGDNAPIQVGEFASDDRLDKVLAKMWLEEGGGGTGQESYELMAYYYAKRSELELGKKGYFFFIGDEGFYPKFSKNQIKTYICNTEAADVPTAKIFKELQKKYHVFFIYPQKSWKKRKVDIDAEIKKRLDDAHGRYEDVDFRASLIWNSYDDLDLHVIFEPDSDSRNAKREHIAYDNKRSKNGQGELDVDRNAGGRQTRKPVENTRWAKGQAPKGKYIVFVRNYSLHDDDSYRKFPMPFKVEVEINGEIQTFEKTITKTEHSAGSCTGPCRNDVVIGEFQFDVSKPSDETSKYAGYDDELIKTQWASVIPQENILLIDDPKAIIDVMMGALALVEGSVDLDQYLIDMTGRGQTQKRLTQTSKALGNLSNINAIVKVDKSKLPSKKSGKRRKSKATLIR